MTMARWLVACIAASLFAAPAAAVPDADPIIGIWRNPHGTIDVQTMACAHRLCGIIVRASPQAVADARESGVDRLIGLQLLNDYRRTASGNWVGRVYVPDMGRSFSSHIELTEPNVLRISGCLIGGFFCKSQLWKRL